VQSADRAVGVTEEAPQHERNGVRRTNPEHGADRASLDLSSQRALIQVTAGDNLVTVTHDRLSVVAVVAD
jgi:hypothetical protein